MVEGPRIGIDDARLVALRERAAGAAVIGALSPALGAAAGAAALASALAAEGHDLDAAAHGNGVELARRLDLAVLAHRTPLVLHVVAVLFDRWAGELEAGPDPAVLFVATSLRRRAHEAWRLLARERTYLRELLGRIAKVDEADAVDAIVAGRASTVLAAWARQAQPALVAGRPQGAVLLRVLRELERDAELEPEARELRESLIDALLAPLRNEDSERSAGRAQIPERIAGLTAWARTWHATEGDPYFGLRTLERLVDLGWELRSSGKYPLLRELYAPFRPMLEMLAAEVRRGGSASSYASLVGDGFVQLACTDPTALAQIATCERALVICPRHKLAESMLAFYLAQRGIELMVAANDMLSPALAIQLEGYLVRAKKLDPNDARLQVFAARFRAVTGRSP